MIKIKLTAVFILFFYPLLTLSAQSYDILKIYNDIGIKRGCLLPGKQIDFDRVNDLFLHDFRHQKFGRITLDYVKDYLNKDV